jgi:hypothetical protein
VERSDENIFSIVESCYRTLYQYIPRHLYLFVFRNIK